MSLSLSSACVVSTIAAERLSRLHVLAISWITSNADLITFMLFSFQSFNFEAICLIIASLFSLAVSLFSLIHSPTAYKADCFSFQAVAFSCVRIDPGSSSASCCSAYSGVNGIPISSSAAAAARGTGALGFFFCGDAGAGARGFAGAAAAVLGRAGAACFLVAEAGR